MATSDASWQSVTKSIGERCRPGGIDLCQPFQLAWYNRTAEEQHQLAPAKQSNDLALVLGNTKALWPVFLRERNARNLAKDENPLERYVEEVIDQSVATALAGSYAYRIRYSHRAEPSFPPIQAIAQSAGLAALSPSNLSIHPIYGPWIALRAVVVIALPGPTTMPSPRTQTPECAAYCQRACLPAFHAALAASTALTLADVVNNWRAWLAVRDACPQGREHRYCDAQIEYHYTKNPRLL